MVKTRKDRNSHSSSAFSKETLDLFKNLTIEGVGHDLVEALQNGLCDNLLDKLDKPDIGLEQISVIKNVGKQLNSRTDENADKGSFVLQALVFLFVRCKAKHAVRQTIASIFQGLPENLKAAAVSVLSKSLEREIRDLERELFVSDKITVDCFNDLFNKGISAIMAFMENFPLGKVAIHESRHEVLSFLFSGLTREMSQLSVAASLDARTTSMMNCLSTLKSTIAVLQCCKSNGQQQIELKNGKTTKILLEMLKISLHITMSSDFLLDCRNAAGVATISILQSLLSKDSLGSAITRVLVRDSPRASDECPTESGDYPMQDSVDISSESYSEKLEQSTCVKDGPNRTAESIVSNDSKIKDRLGKTVEANIPSDSCSKKLEPTTCVKEGPKLAAESVVSNDSKRKDRLGKTIESNVIGYCEEKPELATESIEERVASILQDVYRDGGHCMVSRLVIAHGVVTKLDSDVLHGGVSSKENGGWESLCVSSELNFKSSQGAQTGGLFSSTLLDTLMSICSTVNEKGTTVFAFKTLFCWTVEALTHCKKLKDSGNLTHLKLFSPHSYITPKIIKTLNNYLDHPIDAVRHQVRNSLENIIRIINLFPDSDNHVLDLLEHWVKGSLRVRSNCMALCCIINYVKISDILRIRSSFPLDLIDCLDDANLVSHICDLYIKSATKHRSEITDLQSEITDLQSETLDYKSNYSGWISIWCEPVFDVLSAVDKSRRSAVVDYLVPGLLIGFPNLIRFILDRSKDCVAARDYTITSVVFLARARSLKECAKLKLDQENTGDVDLWHGLIKVDSLRHCLCHIDDQVRIDALSLICESNKTTESFNNQDFELLKFFIPLNMTNQNPLFRNQFVCSLKKAFCRMTERSKTILKRNHDLKTSKVRNDREMNNETIEKGLNEISIYDNFARWLLKFLLDCLHPGSSFPRINTALEIILIFLKILHSSKDSQTCFTNLLSTKDVFTKLGIRTLIGCFHDSFDTNRILANEILSLVPRDLFTFDEDEILCMVKETLSMAKSYQADDTNTAPYFIKLFTSENLAEMVENALINGFVECKELDKDLGCRYTIQLMIGTVLLRMLQEQIQIAERNLLDAAVNAPLHGTLYCLRQLLSTVVLKSAKNHKSWKTFVNNLIEMCFRVSHITGPIVSSNAPEGHVITESADHNVLASHVVDDESDNSTQSAKSKVETQAYRSQLLLSCCWRSMKEVVLILGEIASNAPIYETTSPEDYLQNATRNIAVSNEDITQPLSDLSIKDANEASLDDSSGLLTPNTVIRIGDLFINILLSSRHIGAFELAYPGFVKVCSILWKSEISHLKVLPSKWIEDLLSDLQSCKSAKTFCATRRSAGIPFYISAISSTEPGISRRKTFKKVMEVLIEICQDTAFFKESSDNEIEKTKKVIGLNILRAMFKDTKFGEDVFPYVSDGFIISINGFSSDIWAIRNSCTLLFSALMSRVFGLKKTVMSGTEFFSRFSPLYQFLVNEMKRISGESSRERNQLQLHPSVFPVLYLLSHLYPSSLDGNSSDMNLSSFIPFINSCSDSNVYKIRAMAADALASLVTPSKLTEILNEIIDSMLSLQSGEPLNNNRLNGCLMKIKALLRGKSTNTALSSSLREEIIKGPLVKLSQLIWILDRNHVCSLNKALLLEIIKENVIGITSEEENNLSQHHIASLSTLKTQCLACCLQELGVTSHPSHLPGDEAGEFQLKMIGNDLFRKQCIMVVKNFLDNPDHLSVLGGCLSSKLQPVPLLQLLENEDHDMHLSLLSLLESSDCLLSQNEAAFQILQRRLLEENDVDCAAGICRVLSKQADKIKFPWIFAKDEIYSCEEIWRLLKTKFGKSFKRDIVCTSLLRFCVVFISHFTQQINILETNDDHQRTMLRCLEEIFSFMMDSCKPEETFSSRIVAAEIIASEEYLEIVKSVKDSLSPLITVVFDYWRCVINLLQDEEADIRSLIARKVFPFIKECNIEETHALFSDVPADYFIQPNLVLEITIKVITQIYSSLYPRELLEFLFSLVVGKSASELEMVLKDAGKRRLLQGCFDSEDKKKVEEVERELLQSLGSGDNVSKTATFGPDNFVYDQERILNGELESDLDTEARSVEKKSLSGKETASTAKQDTMETMGIFEQGDSNIYMETITLGHIALTELQNLLTLQTNSCTAINRNFVVYIWSNLKEWIANPKLFYCREYFVSSCQILMGIYILFCFDDVVIKNTLKKGLELFFSRLGGNNFEENVPYSALYNHLRNIRILCEF